MEPLQLTRSPRAHTAMLIRKPVAEVFEAFVDPAITSKFWFSKGSGKLEAGKTVEWHWEMYGFHIPVKVKALEPNQRIAVEWPGDTTVEWTFKARPDGTTFVDVTHSGLTAKTGDELVDTAIDSTGGFTFLLAGAKAWLEHGVQLNLVRDRHPDGL